MRSLEIVLTVLLAVSACSLQLRGLRPWIWLVADVCVLAAHLIIEGGHWQMIPAYIAVLVFTGILILQPGASQPLGLIAVLLLCGASCALSALLPMFRLPAPTGSYLLGTRILQMRTEGESGRRVVVQLWYPAAPSRQAFASYRRREETSRQSSYQAVLTTNSRLNAPVANGSFPVLLFSPAWGGRRTQNTYLLEDLASHGFLVAAIDHPGNSGPTLYDDGHVDQPATGDAMDFAMLTLDEINANGASELERHLEDEIGVLNALARMNQDSATPLYQRLDLSRVGALGHSFGGAVAAEAALKDERIKAALDLDGSLFGKVQRDGIPKPFMLIQEDLPAYADPANRSAADRINDALNASDLEAMKRFGAYRVFLHGSTHESFTDHSLFSPLARLSGVGTIPKEHEYEIVRAYTLAFFERTLRGADPQLLKKLPGPYPEATLELIPAAAARPG
jgi:predicted dienelactone hydrolase